MPFGVYTTALTGLPDNLDLSKLNGYTTADGVGFGVLYESFKEAARQFGSFNWPNHPEMSEVMRYLCAPSSDPAVRLRSGNFALEPVPADNDGVDVRRQRRGRSASQIPQPRGMMALGYSWEAMRPGPEHLHSDDVVSDMLAVNNACVESLRTEFLRCTAYKAARAFEGSDTARAAGWIGGEHQNYLPPVHNGVQFPNHSHFFGGEEATPYAATADGRRALFDKFWRTLWEHGINSTVPAPVFILHGPDSRAHIEADAMYVRKWSPGVDLGVTAPRAEMPDCCHGRMKDSGYVFCQLGGIPEDVYLPVKSYGVLSPQNPIRLFYPGDLGFGPTAMVQRNGTYFPVDVTTPVTAELVADLVCYLHFGFGVKDPLAGGVGQCGLDEWEDPAIV